ncbi:hypothetical protein JZ785_19290 [Alicyclobacillus curvatus]|nr:hypothetical protein JZ785_19290 [Alicyclobacillus curvatus]
MKQLITSLSILAVVSVGLVTGCTSAANNQGAANNGSASNAPVNTAANTPANTANTANTATNTANSAANGTGNGTAASNNTAGGQQNGMSDAQMKAVAKQVLDRYVQSHNDKTAAAYQVDINQILIPGLASAVAASATSGVDYNRPIQSFAVNVTSITPIDQYTFRAIAKANIKYLDGKNENVTYHVILSLNQASGQWLIRSIG